MDRDSLLTIPSDSLKTIEKQNKQKKLALCSRTHCTERNGTAVAQRNHKQTNNNTAHSISQTPACRCQSRCRPAR